MFIIQALKANPLLMPIAVISVYASVYFLLIYLEEKKRFASPETNYNPQVSILIPAYNEEEIIGDTLKTLKGQNYPDKEILVINDGSEDNTYSIAKGFAKENQEVRAYTKENGGKANALNFGMERCRGELILALDADSQLEQGAIEKMASHFKDEEVMAVVPTLKALNPSNIWEEMQSIEYIITSFIRKLLSYISALNVTPGAPMYRKEFFDEHGAFDESTVTEDFEMGLRIQSKGYEIGHAIDAIVHTKVPDSFKSLKRQRLRWGYGNLVNMKKYSHMFNPAYGDLGIFYLPVSLVSRVLPGLLIANIGYKIAIGLIGSVYRQSLIGFDLGSIVLSFQLNPSFNIAYIMYSILIMVGVLTYLVAKNKITDESFSWYYPIYTAIYSWILAFFSILVIARFSLMKKPHW